MELRLQAADGCALPPDTYICVKMADVLKQQRYDPKKAFSFPSVVQRRRATLDFFRRIGTCELEVDPAAAGVKEITVATTETGHGAMRLKLDVQPVAPVDSKGMMKSPHNISSAKAYLAEHNLEGMLQNVVQLLLNDRPENPKEYICTYVKEGKVPLKPPPERPSSADGRQKLPPLETIKAVPEPPNFAAPTSSPAPGAEKEVSAEDALVAAQASLEEALNPTEAKQRANTPKTEALRRKLSKGFADAASAGELERVLDEAHEQAHAPVESTAVQEEPAVVGETKADEESKAVPDEGDENEVDVMPGRPSIAPQDGNYHQQAFAGQPSERTSIIAKAQNALKEGEETGALHNLLAETGEEGQTTRQSQMMEDIPDPVSTTDPAPNEASDPVSEAAADPGPSPPT